MKFQITISTDELKELVMQHIKDKLGIQFDPNRLRIEVKSSQNYRSEWEIADFRATYQGEG